MTISFRFKVIIKVDVIDCQEKAELKKSLQELRMAAEVYRLEMEAKVKAKTKELCCLSDKKAELESKVRILEAEMIAALPKIGELEELKREKAPFFTSTGEQVIQWEQWQNNKACDISITTPVGPATTIGNFGNHANYAHLGEGTQAQALASIYRHNVEWIIDSGASRHVTACLTLLNHALHIPTLKLFKLFMAPPNLSME